MEEPSRTMPILRWLMLSLFGFGLTGTAVDLLLLGHYESGAQIIPLALIGTTMAITLWHIFHRGRASLRTFQGLMILMAAVSLLGMYFHFRGNREFQLEITPSLGGWPLFLKIIRAHAPPAMAPGALLQLALLGLLYCYRHPALVRPKEAESS